MSQALSAQSAGAPQSPPIDVPWSAWMAPLRPFIQVVAAIRASVSVKLLAGFLLGAVLMLGLAVLNFGVINRMNTDLNNVNDAHKRVEYSSNMYYDITAQSHLRGMALLTKQNSYNNTLNDKKTDFAKNFAALQKITPTSSDSDRQQLSALLAQQAQKAQNNTDPEIKKVAPELQKQSAQLLSGGSLLDLVQAENTSLAGSSAKVQNLYQQGNYAEATNVHLSEEHPTSHVLEGQLQALIYKSDGDLAAATSAFQSDRNQLLVTAGAASAASVLIAILLGLILASAFVRPVRVMDHALARIAGGDFGAKVKVPNRDEFGTLAKNLNATSTQLASLYGELQALNAGLEGKVQDQLTEIERASGLRRYLSPQLADSIMSGRMEVGEKPRRRNLTVLFSDLHDFTPLSQRVEPDELVDMLNEYLTAMTEIVFRYGGTLDKYEGDAIMAFYGDPVPLADHPARAVKTALEMRDQLAELQSHWHVLPQPLSIATGISTGYVTVGNIGSPSRLEYTVIGNHVNLAKRLADRAKPGQILISERTLVGVQEYVDATEVFNVRLQGVSKRLKVFEINPRGQTNLTVLPRTAQAEEIG